MYIKGVRIITKRYKKKTPADNKNAAGVSS